MSLQRVRLIVWPLGISALLFALSVAIMAVPYALLDVLLFIAIVANFQIAIILAGAAAALIVGLFWRWHPLSSVTMLFGSIAVVLLANVPTPATSPTHWVASLVQILYYRADLSRQQESERVKGISPATASIVLDGIGSMASGLALDPTGEILLPPDKRSQAWLSSAGQTELGVDTLQARHIIGGYYAWFHY